MDGGCGGAQPQHAACNQRSKTRRHLPEFWILFLGARPEGLRPGLTRFDPPLVGSVAPCRAVASANADATLLACVAGTLWPDQPPKHPDPPAPPSKNPPIRLRVDARPGGLSVHQTALAPACHAMALAPAEGFPPPARRRPRLDFRLHAASFAHPRHFVNTYYIYLMHGRFCPHPVDVEAFLDVGAWSLALFRPSVIHHLSFRTPRLSRRASLRWYKSPHRRNKLQRIVPSRSSYR